MKCNQKLCHRTKNLSSCGICNVCEEVIKENDMKHQKLDKQKVLEKVNVDLKHMISTHKKLANGEKVDSQVVSNLLLGGVINILAQHDAIEDVEKRIKTIEHEEISIKTRIDSLENWVLKQNEQISDLNEKLSSMDNNGVILKETKEIQNLKKQIISLEIDINTVKNSRTFNHPQEQICVKTVPSSKAISCKECGKMFKRNCDLEKHVETVHVSEKTNECEVCGKLFFLHWRLRKHVKMHSEETKFCSFYNNKLDCPYQEIGCMYLHEASGKCDVKECKRKLCQFEHTDAEQNEEEGEDEELVDNQCHFCMKKNECYDSLMSHFQTNHIGYYQELMTNAEDQIRSRVSHIPLWEA